MQSSWTNYKILDSDGDDDDEFIDSDSAASNSDEMALSTRSPSRSKLDQHRKSKKPPRNRTVLSEKQLSTLQTYYQMNPKPDALTKEQLMEVTGLKQRVISVWFQNKRCKEKKRRISDELNKVKCLWTCQNELCKWLIVEQVLWNAGHSRINADGESCRIRPTTPWNWNRKGYYRFKEISKGFQLHEKLLYRDAIRPQNRPVPIQQMHRPIDKFRFVLQSIPQSCTAPLIWCQI